MFYHHGPKDKSYYLSQIWYPCDTDLIPDVLSEDDFRQEVLIVYWKVIQKFKVLGNQSDTNIVSLFRRFLTMKLSRRINIFSKRYHQYVPLPVIPIEPNLDLIAELTIMQPYERYIIELSLTNSSQEYIYDLNKTIEPYYYLRSFINANK